MTRHRGTLLAGLAVTALLLSGCSTGTTPQPKEAPKPEAQSPADPNLLDRTPHPVDWTLEPFDRSQAWLPQTYDERIVLKTNWVTKVDERQGIYLGASEQDGTLRFMAVDSTGATLWGAERLSADNMFALSTTSNDVPLAVLTDREEDGATTVSGFDLSTGELLWGPVLAPGELVGPGLTFSEGAPVTGTAPADMTVLDPDTGEEVTSLPGAPIGEYDGTVVSTKDETVYVTPLHAEGPWSFTSDRPVTSATPRLRPAAGYALLDAGEGAGPLLDLEAQETLADRATDFSVDYLAEIVAVLEDGTVTAHSADHPTTWQLVVEPDTNFEAFGGVMLYLRQGNTIQANNAVTGEVAQAYDPQGSGRIVVPWHIAHDGSAILLDGVDPLLAVIEEGP